MSTSGAWPTPRLQNMKGKCSDQRTMDAGSEPGLFPRGARQHGKVCHGCLNQFERLLTCKAQMTFSPRKKRGGKWRSHRPGRLIRLGSGRAAKTR